jgi:hypothetical protein
LIQIAFRPADGKEGQFRILLGSTDPLAVKLHAINILPIPEMEGYEIAGQFKPGTQIVLQNNSACLGWFDLADLVASQDLDVSRAGQEDASEDFLDAVATAQQTLASMGLSWRWMVAATADGLGLELMLQGLPCAGTALQSMPAFLKDNVATVGLARFPIEANCFDGKAAAGPVPYFFTAKPAEVAKQLLDNPALAHGYCQALASKFLIPELLTSLEGLAYVQGGMPGKRESPFSREWAPEQQQLPAKKHRAGPTSNISGPVGDSQSIQ